MLLHRALLVGWMFALIGCGQSARDRESFPLVDREATKQSFIEAVRDYYQTRSKRGTLSDPFVDENRVKFIFRYKKIIFGKYAEHAQLDLYAEKTGATTGAGTAPAQVPAFYLVGAWYPQQGSDDEAVEVRKRIVDGMIKRLGSPPAVK